MVEVKLDDVNKAKKLYKFVVVKFMMLIRQKSCNILFFKRLKNWYCVKQEICKCLFRLMDNRTRYIHV